MAAPMLMKGTMQKCWSSLCCRTSRLQMHVCYSTSQKLHGQLLKCSHHPLYRILPPPNPASAVLRCNLFTLRRRRTFRPQNSKDKVPQDFTLIHENASNHIIGPCRFLSTAVGLISAGSALGCVILYRDILEKLDVIALATVCVVSVCCVFLVNNLTRYYFMRIYASPDQRTFVGISHSIVGRVQHETYSPHDVKVVQAFKKSHTLHTKSNVKINGRTFHLKGSDFVLPKYYNLHIEQK